MIIGTHDSCAYDFDFSKSFWRNTSKWGALRILSNSSRCVRNKILDVSITQSANVYNQLNMGCRALDIRVSFSGRTFYTSHTFCCKPLEEILGLITKFVTDVTDARVILFIKPDPENAHTIAGREFDLLEMFPRDISNIKCYYEALDGEIYKQFSHIEKSPYKFIWLDVDDTKDFIDKFNGYKNNKLQHCVLYFTLTIETFREALSQSTADNAHKINKLYTILDKNNLPGVIMFDFINTDLLKGLRHLIEF